MKSGSGNTLLHSKTSRLEIWIIVSILIFIVAQFVVGDAFGLERNDRCLALFGCNAGFFGYDAFVHFLAGVMFALFIVWLGWAYPKFRIVSANLWKSVIIIIALCALIETGWEILEFGIDHVNIDVLHQSIVGTNRMLQWGNSDTMGDETFNLVGGVVAIILLMSFKPSTLVESQKSVEDYNFYGNKK